MPRPSFLPVLFTLIALAPLRAEPTAVPTETRTAGAATPADFAELKSLTGAKDTASLLKLVADAKARATGLEDPAARALTLATLDAIAAKPGDAAAILADHDAKLSEIRNRIPETLFLTGLTRAKTDDEVRRFARETYADSDKIGDVFLRRTVRFTLAKLEDRPGEAAAILKDHLKSVGARFHAAALASYEANDAKGAADSVQVAIRCDPESTKARFLFAHLLHTVAGNTDAAVQTLRAGLAHITPEAPDTTAYLDRYFQLLESREDDREVVAEASTLLSKEGFDERCREMMAMHLATCLYYTGAFDDAVGVIRKHHLSKRAQGRLLEAKCLFDSRKHDAATRLLEGSSADFSGAERDAVLSQLQRFWVESGKDSLALAVADQRIREFPERPSPRVHRLWVYDRSGDRTRFSNEVREIFGRFSENQGAMLGVANLAAERGQSGLATDCYRRAAGLNFNKPLFAQLVMEAHVNAREFREAIVAYESFLAMDKSMFKGQEASVHALLAAARIGLGDAVSKSEAERRVKALLETKGLQPGVYMSSARLIRHAGDAPAALKILEAGRRAYPWNNQLRADLAAVRILTGQTEAYGTRPAIEEELLAVSKGRRVNPRLWETVGTWLNTEAKLPVEKLREMRELTAANARPELVKDGMRD